VALNRPLDRPLADNLLGDRRVLRGLLAPALTPDALARLERRRTLWVLTNPALGQPRRPRGLEWRSVRGALLAQTIYDGTLSPEDACVASRRPPTDAEWRDLRMAWGLVVATRSNAVVLVRDGMLVGSGAGQQDRLRACRLAVAKAAARARNAVAASDGFFPFAFGDAPEVLLDAGVTAIIVPPGSRRDADTVALCNARNAVLVFTAKRGFRH
jgi:phosphoribosylaminoimidazolecarboxamide formyltransferase/IMP cyclohydrolase